MSDITLRNVKGTPLTNQEVDDNFANLNADKYQSGDSPTFGDITADSINITGGSSAADISAASIQITGGTGDQGTLTWNTEDETIDLVVSPDVTYQLGQELGFVARNLSGVTLANGRVVRATGSSGNKLTVNLADATTELGSAPTVGVVTETINNNSTGRVTTAGFVRGLNTSGFTEGVPIYLGTNGTFTATKPTSPSHLVHIGWVIRSHATEGSILVHVNNGWELDELHDVLITSVADNEVLQWNAAASVWENRTLAEANIAELGTDVSFQNVQVTGDLTVSGTLTTINAENLSIADNMVYLNDGSTNTNPDLGFAGNYNDGTYAHTGIFRDADDGRWKFYDSYTPEPDASIYIDTSHASFTYANIQAATVYATGGDSSEWNTAYGWGDHSTAGYQPANTALTTSTTFAGDVTGVYNNLTILTPVSGDFWNGGFVRVGTDGVMEVGKYLDFHTSDSGGNVDYDLRVTAAPDLLTVGGTLSATAHQISGTTVIDSSRNLTNIGTISSGDITSSGLTVDYTGNRTGDAGILVTNDASDWGIKVQKDSGADYGILSQTDGENAILVRNAAGVNKIQLQGDGDASFEGTISSGAITSTGSSSFGDVAIGGAADSNYDLKVYGLARFQGAANFVDATNPIQVGGTTVIDSSRNLTNIGTISSGAITCIGNLLAGKSVTTFATEGFFYENGKAVEVTTDSARVMRLNRTTDNGNILELNKDGVVIGSLGSEGGDSLYIGNGDTGIKFSGGANAIQPFDPAAIAASDDAVDLGTSGARFKDLYLSGNINLSASSQINSSTAFYLDSDIIHFRRNNEAESARIDSSGNFLVGKSSSSFTTAGVELAQGGTAGKVQIQRSSSPLTLVNLTDDGGILNFYKATTAVGSIGTHNGIQYIAGASKGLRFDSTQLIPTDNTGANSDASFDLGNSGVRFKDLYLSGYVKASYGYQIGTTTVIDSNRNVTTPIIYGSAGNTALELNNATYTMIADPEGARRVYLGDSGDAGNYYDNNTHYFRDRSSVQRAIIDGAGFNLKVGDYQVNGTTVIDSSRNHFGGQATFSGKVVMGGDGAIAQIANAVAADTSNTYTLAVGSQSGNKSILAARDINTSGGGYQINGTTVIDSSRNLTAVAGSFSDRITGTDNTYAGGIWLSPSSGDAYISANRAADTTGQVGFGWYSAAGMRWVNYLPQDNDNILHWYSATSNTNVMTLDNSGNLDLTSGALKIGGFPVIDSSRNLTNINTAYLPLIYDLNDTAYYVDPNSRSRLLSLTTRNRISIGSNGLLPYEDTGEAGIWYSGTASNATWFLGLNGATTTADFRFYAGGNRFLFSRGGTGTATTDWRAPIFYDSNDTNYYVDPASTSVLNGLNVTTINRDPTVTLSGDVTGSATMTNLGSINIVTTVADNSHSHSNYVEQLSDTTSPNYQDSSSRRVDPNASNPTNEHYAVITFGNEGNVTGQLATHFQTGQPYTRGYNSSWSAWRKIWTDSNDGSGSGLDADLLDGQHGSYYAPATGGNYVAKSGDTMTGVLSISSTNDVQLALVSADSWTGISFDDSGSANDFIWHNGTYGTFAIGGAGSSVSGKKLHVDGGMSVGIDADGTATPTNGIYSQGSVNAPIFYDSDNTAYYLNPNGTSNLSSGTIIGGRYVQNTITVNLSGLDENTYFPVIIPVSSSKPTTIRIEVGLNSGSVPSWSTHPGGFSLQLEWSTIGSGWGTTAVVREVTRWNEGWCTAQIVADIGQLTYSSSEYVRLRGGGIYYFYVSDNITPTLYANGFSANGQTIEATSSAGDPWTATTAGRRMRVFNVNATAGYVSISNPWGTADSAYFPNGISTAGSTNWIYGNTYLGNAPSNGSGCQAEANGNFTATGGVYTAIFYDRDDTAYYVDPAATTAAVVKNIIIKPQSQSWSEGIRIDVPSTTSWAGIRWAYNGETADANNWALGNSSESNTDITFYDGAHKWRLDHSGNNWAYGSMRSPIFYDSDNTNYYLDPASQSRLNIIITDESYTYGWHRNYTSGTGMYNQATTQHFYSDDDDWWNVAGGSAANGIRFRDEHGGTVRGAVYADSSNNVGFLNNGLSWKARVVGGDYFQVDGSSARAPIFYDSQNTNYYVDPAGTSVLSKLIVNNGLKVGEDIYIPDENAQWSAVGDATGCVIIELPQTTSNYDMPIITIETYEYGGQAHTTYTVSGHNWTTPNWYNRNVTAVGLSPDSVRLGVSPNGRHCIIIGTESKVWHYGHVHVTKVAAAPFYASQDWLSDFNTFVTTSLTGYTNVTSDLVCKALVEFDSQTGGFAVGNTMWLATNTSEYNDYNENIRLYPSSNAVSVIAFGATGAAGEPWQSILGFSDRLETRYRSTWEQRQYYGYMEARGSYRAPIFYDSDDTGYYVDPASTSSMNSISLGYNPGTSNSIGCSDWFRSIGASGWYNASYAGGIYMTDSTWVRVYNGKSFYAAGIIQSDTDVRAPLFYDSNDTGYYVDPNSTSRSFRARGEILIGPNTSSRYLRIGGNGGATDYSTVSTSNGNLHIDATSGYNLYLSWYNTADTIVGGGVQATIYYDRNNTGYYLDPASISNLNIVRLAASGAKLDVYDGGLINIYSGSGYAYDNYLYGSTSTNYVTLEPVLGNGLHVKHATNNTGVYIRANGTVEATGDITAYSDERLKENIKTLDGSKVLQMRGVSFTKDGKEGSGVIAQELEKVAPELVNNEGEFKSVAYGNIVGYLIEAIKEQQSQIEALQTEIKSLKEK